MTPQVKQPDARKAIAQYRRHASRYDASAQRTMRLRLRTINKLALQPGDRVLDVASGTGLSFPILRQAVGASGQVIGVDISPEMMSLAQQRVSLAGWDNIVLIHSPIERAQIPGPVDAVLFNFTHDVLRTPAAVKHIFAATRPGTRVAIAGMKYLPWWLAPFNLIVRVKAKPYMTTFAGLHQPWQPVLPYLAEFNWSSHMLGICYMGWGKVRPETVG